MGSHNDASLLTAANAMLRNEVEQLKTALRNADSKLKVYEEHAKFLDRRSNDDPLALLPGKHIQHRINKHVNGIVLTEPDEAGVVSVDCGSYGVKDFHVYALKNYVEPVDTHTPATIWDFAPILGACLFLFVSLLLGNLVIGHFIKWLNT